MTTSFDRLTADAAAAVDPEELRDAQRQLCRQLLAEIREVRRAEAELASLRLRLLAEISKNYPSPIEFLRNDVAPALRITDVEAFQMVERARALTLALPETMAALETGRVSELQATAVADAVEDTTPEVAAVVDSFAMNELELEPLTDRQLYRRAHRKVIKLDPPAAERRHRQQREARALARRLSADGMATLRMYATAQDVAAVWDARTVLADAATVPGDERTLDNRRVDALVDLTTGLLDSGRLPVDDDPCTCDTTDGTGEPVPTHDTGDDEADAADWAAWSAQLADLFEMDTLHPDDCPDCDRSTWFDDDADERCYETQAERDAEISTDAGATPQPEPPPTVGRNPLRRSPTRRTPRKPAPSVLMNVTVPIDLLLGDHTAVADIPHLGPITAGQVAELIDHATLRRILTDPLTGEVLNVGRTRYTPTAAITRHVKMRDQTCVVPGCDQPAARCDLDHRRQFARGGKTAAHNLNLLCRHHHRAKDGGGFHLARTDQGWEWTTALGQTYRRPVTRLYEPGDNYWPLNYRQVDGYDPNKPADTAPPEPEPVLAKRPVLPDAPPF